VPEPVATRRTPALTRRCRELFEQELVSDGWQPGATIPRIAAEVGLTREQVRDAIFAEGADAWRQALVRRIAGSGGRR
jgi:transposase-like protein